MKNIALLSLLFAMSPSLSALADAAPDGAIPSQLTANFIGKVGRGTLYKDGQPLMATEQPCTLMRDTHQSHALKGEQFVRRESIPEAQFAKDSEEFRKGNLTKIDLGFGYLKRNLLRIGYVGEHGKNGLSDSSQIRLPGEPSNPSSTGTIRKFLNSLLTYEAAYKETPISQGTMQGWQICYADNGPKETGPWNYIEAGHDPSQTCDGGDGLIIVIGGRKSCYNDGSWVNKRVRNTKWHMGIENPLDSEWKPGVAGYCYEILFSQDEVQLSSFNVDSTGKKTKETKKATCKI